MERGAPPQATANWRFQQALYRAYYDYYLRARLLYESQLESEAMDRLRETPRVGSLTAMDEAETTLKRALTRPAAQWREPASSSWPRRCSRAFASVERPRYRAIAPDRGANLDMIDLPLNNRGWLMTRFCRDPQTGGRAGAVGAIDEMVNWTNPGPGGFYDNLGNLTRQPHLVRGRGSARIRRTSSRPWWASPSAAWADRCSTSPAPGGRRRSAVRRALEMAYTDLDRARSTKSASCMPGMPRVRRSA